MFIFTVKHYVESHGRKILFSYPFCSFWEWRNILELFGALKQKREWDAKIKQHINKTQIKDRWRENLWNKASCE